MPVRRLQRLIAVVLVALTAACATDREPVMPDDAVQSHRGVWIGKNHHDTMGTVSVHQADDDVLIMIEENFSVPVVPGVVVALGRDGYRSDAVVGNLRRARGRQLFLVPDDLHLTDYNEIWLWDATHDKPVGLARLRGI